ncbi:hypothetical protein [Streptomyces sp. CA-251251]|uniref:hypothetical protein n=1 Tax=Streptomyces sp. CA-251251 TaxID=3240063 RepID=UPI003D8D388B
MPIRYRLLQATTAFVMAAQALVVAVFTFVFNSAESFAPLDEPTESATGRLRISMAIGAVVIAVALSAGAMLIRSCARGTSARSAVAVAAVMELLLVVDALLSGSGSSVLMRGAALAMLALCFLTDPAHLNRGRRARGSHALDSSGTN